MLDPEVLTLLIEIQVLTASGALAPGPLSMATLGAGLRRGWKAGIYAALGHMLAEIPVFYLVALSVLTLNTIGFFRPILALLGGGYILYLGYLHVRMDEVEFRAREEVAHPILIGAIFSLFNPYFIIWWVLIGGIFITHGIEVLGFNMLPLVYAAHVWMDYAWLGFLAFVASMGVKRFGGRLLRLVNIALGLILIYLGATFIYDAVYILFLTG